LSIKHLEDQLTFAQAKLLEKDEVLKKAKNNLFALQEQLSAVQDELITLKSNSASNTNDHTIVENELIELQSKLKDIHRFLVKQLNDFDNIHSHLAIGELQDIDKLINLNVDISQP